MDVIVKNHHAGPVNSSRKEKALPQYRNRANIEG